MFSSVTSVLSTVKSQTDRLKDSLNAPSVQLRKEQLIDLSSKVKSNVAEKSSWIQQSLAQKLQPYLLNNHEDNQPSATKKTNATRLNVPPIKRKTAISTNQSNHSTM